MIRLSLHPISMVHGLNGNVVAVGDLQHKKQDRERCEPMYRVDLLTHLQISAPVHYRSQTPLARSDPTKALGTPLEAENVDLSAPCHQHRNVYSKEDARKVKKIVILCYLAREEAFGFNACAP